VSQKRKRNYSIGCRCSVCGRTFRASRADAKYCSAQCRKKASRSRVGQAVTLNVPDASQMTLEHLEALSRLTNAKVSLRAQIKI